MPVQLGLIIWSASCWLWGDPGTHWHVGKVSSPGSVPRALHPIGDLQLTKVPWVFLGPMPTIRALVWEQLLLSPAAGPKRRRGTGDPAVSRGASPQNLLGLSKTLSKFGSSLQSSISVKLRFPLVFCVRSVSVSQNFCFHNAIRFHFHFCHSPPPRFGEEGKVI